jgi:DNA oxidative demethylase
MNPSGFKLFPGRLDRAAQQVLLDELRAAIAVAPLFTPRMPRTGQPMSVRMTNLGALGWLSDQAGGYRYEPRHPQTGLPWPAIPQSLLALWRDLTGYRADPEACLVNYYGADAKMGLHVDADEQAMDAPVLSISLGDTALFRLGGAKRSDPTARVRLSSGDVCVLAGAARHCFHGVDRILPGASTLLAEGGRFNLTLRRVTVPD